MPVRKDCEIHPSTKIWQPDLVNLYGCKIGKDCNIGAFVEIGNGVVIGDRCKIQAHAFITTGVTLGNDVFIGPGVRFLNDKYAPSEGDWQNTWKTTVEDNVSIGGGAVINPGVTLGAGCLIGSGTVVTKDVQPGRIVVGNPAAPLRKTVG
jgi:UDP-2-acetamido-3-amino-2,3-dideoxy-glucuronate N-acetyltransferase